MTTAEVMMETTVAEMTVMVMMTQVQTTPAHHQQLPMTFKTPSMTAKTQVPVTTTASNRQRFARHG
ncbi:MAG: hypothetical protein B7Y80_17880 [Hyphomicrobium sp. 32-62-53]|nr:MAG: hypothetical protein B7Z29_17805 [Hyphomicrobium sp. 12-62-95]OYX97900.1 MAG: hypothetical protein B7Y80_17880 [Hyphomicrobium sp. 32-62-53]